MPQNNVQLQNGNGSLAGLRNQLINGDFNIWQRGETATSAGYTSDRWVQSGTTNVSKAPASGAPAGTNTAYVMTTGGSLRQAIELPAEGARGKFANGSVWTMSVWATQDLTSQTFRLTFRDVSTSGTNSTNACSTYPNWSVVPGSVISNGFTHYQATVTIDQAPSPTNLSLVVFLPAQSAVGVVSYAMAQFEPGPIATPFEQRPQALELSLCQRYYQQILGTDGDNNNVYVGAGASSNASGRGSFVIMFPGGTMRASPSIIRSTGSVGWGCLGGTPVTGTESAIGLHSYLQTWTTGVGNASRQGSYAFLNSNGFINFDAEL